MRPMTCDRVYLVQEGGEDAIAPILDSVAYFINRLLEPMQKIG
ncbi:hypothetical protein [Coleofasciculus sp. FACHB-1120]|nr:hypothetical protein [Coleofasciculus sp. FACHB-1120]